MGLPAKTRENALDCFLSLQLPTFPVVFFHFVHIRSLLVGSGPAHTASRARLRMVEGILLHGKMSRLLQDSHLWLSGYFFASIIYLYNALCAVHEQDVWSVLAGLWKLQPLTSSEFIYVCIGSILQVITLPSGRHQTEMKVVPAWSSVQLRVPFLSTVQIGPHDLTKQANQVSCLVRSN